MKVIFVAGKYRAATEWELEKNIRCAEEAAIRLWCQGWAVICPHKNSAHFGGLCRDKVWLEGYLTILKGCDAIYMLRNWEQSAGAIEELRIAKEYKLEILYQ